MLKIDEKTQESLTGALFSYYENIRRGNLQVLSALMSEESYFITLESFGFRHVFKESAFKELLNNIGNDEASLKKVETVISDDLKKESREHTIEVVSFEPKAPERITLHYKEDGHPKKLYFSFSDGMWKIDYKAGREKL
ncbi:hypothetical protein KJ877_05815 [bacterium]|nr:hypothetical protein [bacterium]MBU1989700.1 hypothetical protein [bacterium]